MAHVSAHAPQGWHLDAVRVSLGQRGWHHRPQAVCPPLSRLLPGSVPSAYGTLTVRSLLDTREHCLNEFSFPDPYSKVRAAFPGS